MADYDSQGLELHHFYRAMAWLGEEVEEKAADVLAPRCVKDLIEEKLFDRGRDLFISASVSLSFYGEGGETLEAQLFQRPDLKQMILGLVVDGSGTPICTDM